MNDLHSTPSIDPEDDNMNLQDDQPTATRLKKYVTIIGPKKDNKWVCNFGCKVEPYTGTYSRIRGHFLGRAPGQKAIGVMQCSKVTKDDKERMRKEEHDAQQLFARSSRKGVNVVVRPTTSIGTTKNDSRIVSDMFDMFSRGDVDGLIGKFFYGCGIPFNVARSPFFHDMVKGINEASRGYKPPSADKIRTSLLDKEKSKLDRHLAGIKDQWPTFGVSIVSDGWSNIKNQPIINVVAISGGRAMFLNGIDCSGDEKSGVFISEILFKAIENVGVYNVVQILTDNASACKLAGDIVMEKYPHIFWSGCMAHSLSLLMKDIATSHDPNLKFIMKLYGKVKDIVKYVRTHSMVLYIFRKFSALEVIQVKKTRFGHHYVVLERINRLKNHLISMVLSEEWDRIKCGSSSSKLQHEEIKRTILDTVIGEVYQRMEDMLSSIEVILLDKPEILNVVRHILLQRWQKMNIPLHLLAYVLTPFYYSTTWLASSNPKGDQRRKPHADPIVQHMYLDVVDRLLGNSIEAARARIQLSDFVSNAGISLAVRVLSQSVNSSCAERVWSTYSFIHSVARNRMNADRAESLVYVHYNTRLLSRYRDDYEKAYKDWGSYVEDNLINFNLREIEDRDEVMATRHDDIGSSSLPNPPQATQEQNQHEGTTSQVNEGQLTSQATRTKQARHCSNNLVF
ncbi:hypothetical protein ACJIZ3_009106 [Penstemon smallii]|uniref:DUF659 domain-containing protein n=1 Tax=Penstemon smallii TaxID=265156 RepID=A0ABD3TCZ9_9LAMI